MDSSGFGGPDADTAALLAKRRYLYASGPVCYRCGQAGHEGLACEAPYCEACDLFGHEKGDCRWVGVAAPVTLSRGGAGASGAWPMSVL
jgi:hypothetical protein